MTGHVVMVKLIFNPADYFLWTGRDDINKLGQSISKDFRKRMNCTVHIFNRYKDFVTLCGQFDTVQKHLWDKHGGHDAVPWKTQITARSLTTSVERQGAISQNAQSNITFMRLCKQCAAKAEDVHIRISIGADKNNEWNHEEEVTIPLPELDVDEWREKGLYV